MKKFLISFISILAVVSLMLGSAFSTSADAIKFEFKLTQSGWGTEEDGVIARFANSYPGYHTPWNEAGGHPNLDFEKGLMYWSTTKETLKPSDYVDIVEEENGNHYLTFTATNTYDGIESVPFVESRITADDEICVVFKWRGDDPNFQVYLNQLRYKTTDGTSKDSHRVSHNGDAKRNEIIVDGEDGWNVAYCKPENDSIKEPYDIMPYYIFNIGVQVCNDPTCVAQVDDIRLAKYSQTSNKLFDLDGNLMYDLNNMNPDEGEDLLNASMFPDINYDITYDEVYNANSSGAAKNAQIEEGNGIFFKNGSPTVVFWIIIACGAVIIIAAAVVIVLVIAKKKKNGSSPEGEGSEPPDSNESDSTDEDTSEQP